MSSEIKFTNATNHSDKVQRIIQRDYVFLHYLTTVAKSPLRGAMAKVDMNKDQIADWIGRLWWPYFHPAHVLGQWEREAKQVAEQPLPKGQRRRR